MDGVDPVMATFQVCDANLDNGLNMEEITQDGCKEFLQTLFGLSTDLLQDTFFGLDENMDKVISIEEGHAASQTFDRMRQCHKNIKFGGPECTATFGTKVLITAGGNYGPSLTSEIIDLENPSFGCKTFGKFPQPLYSANGGGGFFTVKNGQKWNDNPMVCGGSDAFGRTFQKSCYTLLTNGTWKEDEEATLSRGKQNQISGSVVINNQLYVPEYVGVGKASVSGRYKKGYLNFEIAAPNTAPKTLKFEKLWGFFDIYGSCIVKWDTNTIMLIGVNEGSNAATFFINIEKKTVTPGPQLKHGRSGHACNEMTINGKSYIIVIGGFRAQSGILMPTEILPKSSFGKGGWQLGNKLNIT